MTNLETLIDEHVDANNLLRPTSVGGVSKNIIALAKNAFYRINVHSIDELCGPNFFKDRQIRSLKDVRFVGDAVLRFMRDVVRPHGVDITRMGHIVDLRSAPNKPIEPIEETESPNCERVPLRDYFAARAMSGLMAQPIVNELTRLRLEDGSDPKEIEKEFLKTLARGAYVAADAMLEARKATP